MTLDDVLHKKYIVEKAENMKRGAIMLALPAISFPNLMPLSISKFFAVKKIMIVEDIEIANRTFFISFISLMNREQQYNKTKVLMIS